eukprot:SAG11_NODE_3525_length_2394_cov_1.450545_4_plen_113_part_00
MHQTSGPSAAEEAATPMVPQLTLATCGEEPIPAELQPAVTEAVAELEAFARAEAEAGATQSLDSVACWLANRLRLAMKDHGESQSGGHGGALLSLARPYTVTRFVNINFRQL